MYRDHHKVAPVLYWLKIGKELKIFRYMASTDQLKVNLNLDPSCEGVFEALCNDQTVGSHSLM